MIKILSNYKKLFDVTSIRIIVKKEETLVNGNNYDDYPLIKDLTTLQYLRNYLILKNPLANVMN